MLTLEDFVRAVIERELTAYTKGRMQLDVSRCEDHVQVQRWTGDRWDIVRVRFETESHTPDFSCTTTTEGK